MPSLSLLLQSTDKDTKDKDSKEKPKEKAPEPAAPASWGGKSTFANVSTPCPLLILLFSFTDIAALAPMIAVGDDLDTGISGPDLGQNPLWR